MTLPHLARRTSRIRPFQVMELIKRAHALALTGKPVLHLSIGEPDFTAPLPVIEALEQAARDGHTHYTGATGIEPLRRAIARDYARRYGVEVSPERVVLTAGASGALSLACCALVDPGARVLLTDPGYPCNRHFVAAYDGIPEPVPVGPQTRFQLSAELLRQHWRDDVGGVLLASPANPTGTSLPFEELAAIVAETRAREGFAIVDEIYLGLSYQDRARTALELGEDVIVVNSFSKYFHMTGWRLGWMVVPEALAPDFEKLAQNLYICPSALAQHAALACFTEQASAIFEARRQEFRRRRDYLVPALRALGLEIPVEPDGAFYVYVDCSRFTDDSAAFADELLEQAWVSVVPGDDFGSNEPHRYLRLSYASSMEHLREAVERIGRFLHARKRR